MRVVIAGGGTGGHLYPGIAVARELQRRMPDASVSFAGTARGIESRVVPREGFALDFLRSAGLKGKSLSARVRGAALVPLGLADAWRILSARTPDAVIGVGGYSSGPVVMAAALRGIPTMVLEQNAVPGLTNRVLSRVVRAAAVTYDETLAYFRGRGFVAGNPVRAEFFQAAETRARRDASQPPRVLILGGSQGAHAINVAMVAAAAELARHASVGTQLRIVHQTGERDLAFVRQGYASAGLAARVEAFLDPVAPEMTSADVVLCRAGATTLAELAASGRPAVLIPFPNAADDHQRKNAMVLATAGAAMCIDERELSGSSLASTLSALVDDRARLAQMSEAMRRFARPNAARDIVDRLLEIVRGGQ